MANELFVINALARPQKASRRGFVRPNGFPPQVSGFRLYGRGAKFRREASCFSARTIYRGKALQRDQRNRDRRHQHGAWRGGLRRKCLCGGVCGSYPRNEPPRDRGNTRTFMEKLQDTLLVQPRQQEEADALRFMNREGALNLSQEASARRQEVASFESQLVMARIDLQTELASLERQMQELAKVDTQLVDLDYIEASGKKWRRKRRRQA